MRTHAFVRSVVMLALIASFLIQPNASAQSRGIDGAITSSTLIVVARLDQFIAEPESVDHMVQEKMRSSMGIAGGNVEAMVMSTINPRGTYVFSVVSTFKGKAPQPLIVRIPRVTSMEGMLRGSGAGVPLKANYLLMLSGTEETGFAPAFRSPLRISPATVLPKEPIDDSILGATNDAVLQLFIDSLAEPEMRQGAAQILSDIVSEKVAGIMRKYLDDPDDGLRASAITCLATNQDVTVIPRIANWKYSDPNRSGNGLLSNLSKFKSPDAIPYLNQLLLDKTSVYIPLNAAQALRQLPLDKSSTPFWMVALHDSEQQGIAAYGAYSSIHKMYPELGDPQNALYFRTNRAAETAKLDAWWADEQAGKHQP